MVEEELQSQREELENKIISLVLLSFHNVTLIFLLEALYACK